MKLRHVFLAGIDLFLAYGLVYALGPYAHEWGDAALHVLAGAFLVIFWFWLRDRFPLVLSGAEGPVRFRGIGFFGGAIIAVLLGSLIWEGFEVILRDFSPHYASVLGFNSPENDSFSDVLFALLGGVVTYFLFSRFGIIKYINKRSHNP